MESITSQSEATMDNQRLDSAQMLRIFENEKSRGGTRFALDLVTRRVLRCFEDELERIPRFRGGREGMVRIMRNIDSEWIRFAQTVPEAELDSFRRHIKEIAGKPGCDLNFRSATNEVLDMLSQTSNL
ncbi:hypothetical protein COW81_02750 [Candidatus Campbellbacteria bacterium CG22_combo_CG10-13_8_21_14_all_36_13]|uniref:Uncharacterized protein n=1 Tax=Candidatus Campbellbacteria bacterium CG22_combo_CG10-13_8_21_14_all_36_13 TaxID=1974529 RepID=A0A2H0DZF8_9BACT|nr:MAG: hypothetical protein COW81_02750 [Candidatus Campbellbacteria bacterium CG22_combo_CG10-13_8_21_14_all_36_13]